MKAKEKLKYIMPYLKNMAIERGDDEAIELIKLIGKNSKPVTWNHAFSIAFSISGSTDPKGNDINSGKFRAAITKRMNELDSSGQLEWEEAVGAPFDTYEE